MKKTIAAVGVFLTALLAPGSESPFGVCAHLNRWEFPEMPRELQMMDEAGIGLVRTDLDWNQVEGTPEQWNFSRWDALLEKASSAGIDVLPILGGFQPKWGSPVVKHPELWERYLIKAVSRYKDRIRYWEVINEPDLGEFAGKGEEYGKFLAESAKIIRRVAPDAVVVMGGLAGVEYADQVMKHTGADGFDIANIHLYYWQGLPETALVQDLKHFRKLMERHGAGQKPLWLTETGYSTASQIDFKPLITAALEKLGLAPALPVVFLHDDEYHYYTDGVNLTPDAFFAEDRPIRRIALSKLEQLDPAREPLLMLPASESFPGRYLEALVGYLNRGGTVIYPGGGIPFYYDLVRLADGTIERRNAPDQMQKALHLDWEAWWKTPSAPKGTRLLEVAPGFQFDLTGFPGGNRFLGKGNLKDGDRMIPLVNGRSKEGNYTAPVAAIYRYNSDLKGNFIAFTWQDSSHRTTPEMQAKLLARTFLLAFHAGADKVFTYSFRSMHPLSSKAREGHFGLLYRDMKEKPAFRAYSILTAMYPAGSQGLEVFQHGSVYCAAWTRPDGVPMLAVWSLMRPVSLTLPYTGRLSNAVNHLGERADVKQDGTRLKFTATPGVIYLEGVRLNGRPEQGVRFEK